MIEAPDILERLRSLVTDGGRVAGIFDRSVLSQSRALELIDLLIESLPDEIDQARGLVDEREKIIDDARRQAGEIIDNAVRKAEKLIDADEITQGARKRAMEMMDEAEEYTAERLKGLAEELERLYEEVHNGLKTLGTAEVDHER